MSNTQNSLQLELHVPLGFSVVWERQPEGLVLQPWGLENFRVEGPLGWYVRVTVPHDIVDPANAVE